MHLHGETRARAGTGTGLFSGVATQSRPGVFNDGFRGFVETEITDPRGNNGYTQNELVLVMFIDRGDQSESLWRRLDAVTA